MNETKTPLSPEAAAMLARHPFMVVAPSGEAGRFASLACAARTACFLGTGHFVQHADSGATWEMDKLWRLTR